MKINPIKAFFEYGYLNEEDSEYLRKDGIIVEDWFGDITNEHEQRICLNDLDEKQKEIVKAFVVGVNHKYIDKFDYVIFYN